ncbi:MAG TPA: hypothetical protein VK797_27925 [Tepidisphaeraceae bacterium]|nr:hypothetical protein [Tepidisphaeraceae bacterium]
MKSRSRHILAVVAVMTALCADRAVSAAPVSRTPVAEMAARLVIRLSESFSRVAPASICPELRLDLSGREGQAPAFVPQPSIVHHLSLSPFEFRLPPPSQC